MYQKVDKSETENEFSYRLFVGLMSGNINVRLKSLEKIHLLKKTFKIEIDEKYNK